MGTRGCCRHRRGLRVGIEQAQESAASGGQNKGTLRIAQWNHYTSGYDRWWDEEYTRRWGERNGVEVVVDHFDNTQAAVHAEAEVATRRGHDIFQLNFGSPAAFEDEVIDHREIVEEVEAKLGKMMPLVERTVFNPGHRSTLGSPISGYPTLSITALISGNPSVSDLTPGTTFSPPAASSEPRPIPSESR